MPVKIFIFWIKNETSVLSSAFICEQCFWKEELLKVLHIWYIQYQVVVNMKSLTTFVIFHLLFFICMAGLQFVS
jgi:hypothetical protein